MPGATVFVNVSVEMVGELLHRLEDCADVCLLSRVAEPELNRERWHLRYDLWPESWDGREAVVWWDGDAMVTTVDETHCGQCGASLVTCRLCGARWCLDHQAHPLRCPHCGKYPAEGS